MWFHFVKAVLIHIPFGRIGFHPPVFTDCDQLVTAYRPPNTDCRWRSSTRLRCLLIQSDILSQISTEEHQSFHLQSRYCGLLDPAPTTTVIPRIFWVSTGYCQVISRQTSRYKIQRLNLVRPLDHSPDKVLSLPDRACFAGRKCDPPLVTHRKQSPAVLYVEKLEQRKSSYLVRWMQGQSKFLAEPLSGSLKPKGRK